MSDHSGNGMWSALRCRLGKGPSRGDAGSSRAALAPQRIGGGGFVGSIVLQTWSGCPALQAARFRRGRDTDGGVPVPPLPVVLRPPPPVVLRPPPTVMPVPPLPVVLRPPLPVVLRPPPTVMPVPPLPTSTGPVITPDRHSPVLLCTMVPFGWRVHVWSSAAPPARVPLHTSSVKVEEAAPVRQSPLAMCVIGPVPLGSW